MRRGVRVVAVILFQKLIPLTLSLKAAVLLVPSVISFRRTIGWDGTVAEEAVERGAKVFGDVPALAM